MMSEIYQTLHEWLSSIFDENMTIKVWQYIYGADVITSRSDLVNYLSEMLSLGVIIIILLFIMMSFVAVFKLVFRVIKWY